MTRLSKLDRSVEGRVAVVTGAGSGMGRATAELFADEGSLVAALDITDAVLGVAEEIREAGGRAEAWVLDVTDQAALARCVEEVRERLGSVDVVVNNAGINLAAPIDSEDFEERWARVLDVNLTAHTRLIRLCLPDLLRNGDGRIVNISSTEGIGGSAYISPYTASKHGVIGLTRSLAVELGPTGVTVNAVCPGPVHTGMTAGIADADKEKFARRRVPLRRYGDPEEVAQVTLSLCLPAASYITGQAVAVDGGMTIRNN